MKIALCWFACWACYYTGDVASKILDLFGNSNAWACFWYPIYNKFMLWSNRLQDAAGYNPDNVNDVSNWPWSSCTEDKEEKEE